MLVVFFPNRAAHTLYFVGYAPSGHESDGGKAILAESDPISYLNKQCDLKYKGSRAALDTEVMFRRIKSLPKKPSDSFKKDEKGLRGAVFACASGCSDSDGKYTRAVNYAQDKWPTNFAEFKKCNHWCELVVCVEG